MNKKLGIIIPLAILVVILLFLGGIINFIVNIKWFMEVGYLSIFFTKMFAVLKLMLPMFIITYICIFLYYKSIKKSILKYSNILESSNSKTEKVIVTIVNIAISFTVSYVFSSTYWYRILQFNNSVKFNESDPIFLKDVSFFIFKLPLIESIYDILISLLMFLVIITFVVYFIMIAKDKISFGNVSLKVKMKSGFTKFAGRQLAIVSALILAVLSLGYKIKEWNLVYSPRGIAFGASYTDVKVTLVFYKIITIVSLISAVVIFVSVLSSKVKPIIISISLIIVLILAEKASATIVQNFIVKSNEKSLEQKYLKYNIDYTRKAFNLDKIEERDFEVKNNLTTDDIKNNKDIIENVRINSFSPALEFYNQVQMIRYYYNFNDIDVDRYKINGKYNQVFIAPREVNTDVVEPDTWQNKHLTYTHGYGVVMSKVNSVTSEGQPDFVIKDIPPENTSDVKLDNPRIYFGEKTNDYAVVNTNMGEFDYPKGGENQTNKYDGKAGIKMNFFNRLLFSAYYKNINFILSNAITSDSKILMNRNIVDRAKKIAPFLVYDDDPYAVINEGRLKWIIDAYTVSNRYPFSQPYNNINYIRNSIKIVIDAVDGDINFYIVDENDPIASSYTKIFPKLFKPQSEINQELREHFRYPQGIFKIQCNVLGKYHMTDPMVAYTGEDLWSESKQDTSAQSEQKVNEGCYVVMKLPEEKQGEMVLLEYFNMRGKDNMVAMLGARMDEENYGNMVLYKFPPQKTIYSPYMFQQQLKQDPIISKELTLWGSSNVKFGDTIIVPLNNSLLYFEPMYLRATGKNSIPEMKRVILSYNGKVVIAENAEKAIEQVFTLNQNKEPQVSFNNAIVSSTIKEAAEYYDKAIEAQKQGDWSKYGEYIKKLGEVLKKGLQ